MSAATTGLPAVLRPPAWRRIARSIPARHGLAGSGAVYLLLSAGLWWHIWLHPSTVTTCGCGDAALTLWVLEWPAYALAHGHNLFFSTSLFHPIGINMAPNSLALGTVLAPVTWLFGPVTTMNAVDVLSPALSALSMCYLLRRWVTWRPAAFAGGLLFGFSPFALGSLALAHPNFGLLAVPPLIVACIDELVVRRVRRRAFTGAVLGVLLAVELFISVEVLALIALSCMLAAACWAVVAATRDPRRLAHHVAAVMPGLAVTAGVDIVLLAYPLWFFFAGPAHLTGRVWPGAPPGTVAATPAGFVGGSISPALVGIMRLFGGYQGPALPPLSFLGYGLVVVVVVGLTVFRRDGRAMFFGATGLVAAALSLGVGNGYWAPWRLFVHIPVLVNVVPVNISVVTDFCASVVLGIVVGHVQARVAGRAGPVTERRPVATSPADPPEEAIEAPEHRRHRRRSALAGTAVAVAALAPVAGALWPNMPMTVRPVVVPRWFAVVAPHLRPGQVVLPYPESFGGIQSSMAWLALAGSSYSMPGGGGPGVVAARAGSVRRGYELLAQASYPLSPPPALDPGNIGAVRRALSTWGVTTIVVPDEAALPSYDRGRSTAYAVGLFTAVVGSPPSLQEHAWVWTRVRAAPAR